MKVQDMKVRRRIPSEEFPQKNSLKGPLIPPVGVDLEPHFGESAPSCHILDAETEQGVTA